MLPKKPWDGYITPGKIFGNLYFVGTVPSSVHLVDTGDGLILIDAGYLDNLYLTVHNIHALGFDPMNIKYILLSHGHYDHTNGAEALARLTGAKTLLGTADLPLVSGELNHFALPTYPFKPDILLQDGDIITLGNTSVRCVSSPGHTDGVMSFFFDITDGTRTLRAGMHGGVGLNTLNRDFLTRNALPFENREKYFATLAKLEREHVDVFIGNHVGNNDTVGKLNAMAADGQNPFVDPSAWGAFLAQCRTNLETLIREEAALD